MKFWDSDAGALLMVGLVMSLPIVLFGLGSLLFTLVAALVACLCS